MFLLLLHTKSRFQVGHLGKTKNKILQTYSPAYINFQMSLLGTVLIHLGELFIPPPPNLQDLWILIYAVYSFFHFLFFYFYVLRKQYQRGLEEKVKEHRD